MRISIHTLRANNACSEARKKFRELFGEAEIEVTKELCVKHFEDFDWDWAATRLLTEALYNEYAVLEQALWNEYHKKYTDLTREQSRFPILEKQYEEYEEKIRVSWREYDKKAAELFGQFAERC